MPRTRATTVAADGHREVPEIKSSHDNACVTGCAAAIATATAAPTTATTTATASATAATDYGARVVVANSSAATPVRRLYSAARRSYNLT